MKSVLVVIIFCLLIFVQATASWAVSSTLYNLVDIVSDTNPFSPNVMHAVSFTLPTDSFSLATTDYVQIHLPNFTNLNVDSAIVSGEFTGTPTISVAGTTVKVTNITLLPGKSLNITGFTANNPAAYSSTNFQIIVAITSDEAGTLVNNTASTVATKHPGRVSVTAEVLTPLGRLQIIGLTGPLGFVYFTDGANIIGTDISSPVGEFSKIFSALQPRTHNISLYGIDSQNRATSVTPISAYVPQYQTITISDVLLSPTIEINSSSILQGQPLHATGSAYPGTQITIFAESPLRTYVASTSALGLWTHSILDTNDYNPGDYRIFSQAQTSGGLQSPMSPSLMFTITTSGGGGGGSACGDIDKGDLNCDDIINLTDFSILMYYWGTTDPVADINQDGIVNLTDFSIMMYWWGT